MMPASIASAVRSGADRPTSVGWIRSPKSTTSAAYAPVPARNGQSRARTGKRNVLRNARRVSSGMERWIGGDRNSARRDYSASRFFSFHQRSSICRAFVDHCLSVVLQFAAQASSSLLADFQRGSGGSSGTSQSCQAVPSSSFRSIRSASVSSCRSRRLEHPEFEPLDLVERLARDSLEVAVHPRGRLDDAVNLRLALGPQPRHGLAFLVQVALHLLEPLDDGLDSLPESRTGQVLVDQFHLGLLALARLPRAGDLDQAFAGGRSPRE